MTQFRTEFCVAILFFTFFPGSGKAAQAKQGDGKPASANRSANPKPALNVDEARMIVKDIPSVDIKATLARWKLAEPELVQLRQWSNMLVENPARTDLLPRWNELISQVSLRNHQVKESDVTPLIRLVMLAAYEEAQKVQEAAPAGQGNVYKELQEQVRANLSQARQLQVLAGSQSRDALSGSQLSLPAYQRVLRKCEVLAGSLPKLECRETMVSTSHELDDYISVSEKQLKMAEEKSKQAGSSENSQGKRLEILYALSDLAKLLHDSASTVLRQRS